MNIIITGASRGLGYETVLRLSGDQRNHILALARSGKKLEELQKDCRSAYSGADVSVLPFDILGDDHLRLTRLIETKFDGKLHLLINNAGAMINKPFEALKDEDFEALWRSNLLGTVRMIRRSEEHTSELQSLMRISYAVFCLQKNK